MSKLRRCHYVVNGIRCMQRRGLSCSKPLFRDQNIVQENDVVLLKRIRGFSPSKVGIKEFLTPPLKSATTVRGKNWASFAADDIIGKRYGGVVGLGLRGNGSQCRISQPTLQDYVEQTPRMVTPIYPASCSIAVSLLDLHPTVPGSGDDDKRFEIFEAGTGHGALTMHLARAIYGANSAPPAIPPYCKQISLRNNDMADIAAPLEEMNEEKAGHVSSSSSESFGDDSGKQQIFDEWRKRRRAIIHTLDRSPQYSMHAQKTIMNFRRGLYYPHIDFHTGTIERYLNRRLGESRDPIFDHAILDLAGPSDYLELVAQALKTNGNLIIFTPGVPQLLECLELVKQRKILLWLEKTVEVGAGIAHGGRDWDIRYVRPRTAKVIEEAQDGSLSDDEGTQEAAEETVEPGPVRPGMDGLKLVCKPTTGTIVTAGGFISLWRKMSPYV